MLSWPCQVLSMTHGHTALDTVTIFSFVHAINCHEWTYMTGLEWDMGYAAT